MDLVRRIAPGRRVVALDLPGHGQSDAWHESSIPLYRDAVGTMCAKLKLEKVVLLGHSMGGLIALGCALAWPERVAGLVLVNSGAHLRASSELVHAIEHDFASFPAYFNRLAWSPSTPKEL